jgi:hypothetical protein
MAVQMALGAEGRQVVRMISESQREVSGVSEYKKRAGIFNHCGAVR